jgi:hypothetical protein
VTSYDDVPEMDKKSARIAVVGGGGGMIRPEARPAGLHARLAPCPTKVPSISHKVTGLLLLLVKIYENLYVPLDVMVSFKFLKTSEMFFSSR